MIIIAPIKLYISYVIHSLWAAPFLAWLLLVSSWTKRKPILMALIPIGIISFMEGYINRTAYFMSMVKERVVGWVAPLDTSTARYLGDGEYITNQEMVYGKAHTLLTLPDFWYGLLLAGLMVAAAVYIRRFRDES